MLLHPSHLMDDLTKRQTRIVLDHDYVNVRWAVKIDTCIPSCKMPSYASQITQTNYSIDCNRSHLIHIFMITRQLSLSLQATAR